MHVYATCVAKRELTAQYSVPEDMPFISFVPSKNFELNEKPLMRAELLGRISSLGPHNVLEEMRSVAQAELDELNREEQGCVEEGGTVQKAMHQDQLESFAEVHERL